MFIVRNREGGSVLLCEQKKKIVMAFDIKNQKVKKIFIPKFELQLKYKDLELLGKYKGNKKNLKEYAENFLVLSYKAFKRRKKCLT